MDEDNRTTMLTTTWWGVIDYICILQAIIATAGMDVPKEPTARLAGAVKKQQMEAIRGDA